MEKYYDVLGLGVFTRSEIVKGVLVAAAIVAGVLALSFLLGAMHQ